MGEGVRSYSSRLIRRHRIPFSLAGAPIFAVVWGPLPSPWFGSLDVLGPGTLATDGHDEDTTFPSISDFTFRFLKGWELSMQPALHPSDGNSVWIQGSRTLSSFSLEFEGMWVGTSSSPQLCCLPLPRSSLLKGKEEAKWWASGGGPSTPTPHPFLRGYWHFAIQSMTFYLLGLGNSLKVW